MKTKILSLLLIATFAISTTTMAQQSERRNEKPGKKECMQKPHDKKRCNMRDFFTLEQQEKVKEFHLQAAKNIKPLRNELNELKAHQQTLTTADKADMNAIYANIEKIAKTKAEIMKIKAKEHQDIRSILTEEQLIKFDMMKDRQNGPEKFGERPMGKDMGKPMHGEKPECGE